MDFKEKIARITKELDKIADNIEMDAPEVALRLDHISDFLEKKAYTPQGWLPGRGMGPGVGRGYGMGWMPGRRFMGPPPGYMGLPTSCVCPSCGYRHRHEPSIPCLATKCPKCNVPMVREATSVKPH